MGDNAAFVPKHRAVLSRRERPVARALPVRFLHLHKRSRSLHDRSPAAERLLARTLSCTRSVGGRWVLAHRDGACGCRIAGRRRLGRARVVGRRAHRCRERQFQHMLGRSVWASAAPKFKLLDTDIRVLGDRAVLCRCGPVFLRSRGRTLRLLRSRPCRMRFLGTRNAASPARRSRGRCSPDRNVGVTRTPCHRDRENPLEAVGRLRRVRIGVQPVRAVRHHRGGSGRL